MGIQYFHENKFQVTLFFHYYSHLFFSQILIGKYQQLIYTHKIELPQSLLTFVFFFIIFKLNKIFKIYLENLIFTETHK